MCGIAGILGLDRAGAGVDAARLRPMMDAIAHRGPDGSGCFVQGRVGLGHRRLSIIDLDGGAQPMGSDDGAIQLVFNGEIYNFVELRAELARAGHRFRTRSDTEVIVRAYEHWGEECVTRFNGMFAFALWDGRHGRLFAARDQLGVKPLYYTIVDGQLLFASEVKALLAHPACPRAVDLASLHQLSVLGYVPSPRTLFEGIARLPPGHLLCERDGGVAIRRFWGGRPLQHAPASEAEAVERYADLALEATRRQLRSDVPVGLFLSSGIDSASLLAMMRRSSAGPLHTFTIGFDGGGEGNETDDARVLARRFGADHAELVVGAADYAAYFERYMGDLEEPVCNESAAAFHFVSMIASRAVKVVLTGQGADEPWAGYHRHLGMSLSAHYRRLPRAVSEGIIRPLVMALPRHARLKRGVQALGEADPLARLTAVYSIFPSAMRERLFSASTRGAPGFASGSELAGLAGLLEEYRGLDDLSQMLYVDTRTSLPDDLLMVNDKMSMAHSIEARVPFLDVPLVEFVEGLPAGCKLRFGRGKYLHKRALARWVPPDVVRRRKKGFDNPVGSWLRTRLRPQVHELLFSADAACRRFFDMAYVRQLVEEHENGREDRLRHVYLLISFEMWHRRFMGVA